MTAQHTVTKQEPNEEEPKGVSELSNFPGPKCPHKLKPGATDLPQNTLMDDTSFTIRVYVTCLKRLSTTTREPQHAWKCKTPPPKAPHTYPHSKRHFYPP